MIGEVAIVVVASVVRVITAPIRLPRYAIQRFKFHRRKRWFMKHWQFSEPYARAWAAKYDW